MERVFLVTDKGYLESVGKIIGDACNGLQSMYGVRLALPGAPPPPMVALLPLGGGSSDTDNELLSQIVAGAEPKVLAPKLQPPLRDVVVLAKRLRAACFERTRATMCDPRGCDPWDALEWLDSVNAMIDAATTAQSE